MVNILGRWSPLLAALMIWGAVIYGVQTVGDLFERQNDEVALLRLIVTQLEQKLESLPEPEPQPQPSRRVQAETQQRSVEAIRRTVDIAGSPQLGSSDAVVTLVEFSDFDCPYCRRVLPTMEQIKDAYGDSVKIVFKHLPLSRIHPNAMGAHVAAEAAHKQGKFWEMHDRIFENPQDRSSQAYARYAADIGLDADEFIQDLESSEIRERVQRDIAEARRLGLRGTPSFFINGQFVAGAIPFESFKRLIDQELDSN